MDVEEFADLVASGDGTVAECLLILSQLLTRRWDAIETGLLMLGDFASDVEDRSVDGIAAVVLGRDGLSGDVEDYHAEENSLLDRVLERQVGMPITLSAAVVHVGGLVGVDLKMVGLPGHVIVGTDDPDVYVDAFGGAVVGMDWIRHRYRSIFGPEAELPPSALAPMSNEGTVVRVCNNLFRTWAQDRTGKLERLLDVRSRLRVTRADAEFLLPVAVARGQYDLAARFTQLINPDDPQVDEFSARLN